MGLSQLGRRDTEGRRCPESCRRDEGSERKRDRARARARASEGRGGPSNGAEGENENG